jgi:hypothetical protein
VNPVLLVFTCAGRQFVTRYKYTFLVVYNTPSTPLEIHMAFTKENIRGIHVELDKVLQEFAKKHNLVVGDSKILFSPEDFKVTVNFNDASDNPAGIDPRYLRDLITRGIAYGLASNMVGTKLTLPGKGGRSNYEFVGMRASKAAAKCLDDGKVYLWDAKFIALQINLQTAKK